MIQIPENENPNGRTIVTANIVWNGTNLGPFPDLMVDHGFIPHYNWTGWTPSKKPTLVFWINNNNRRSAKFFK